jgi:hypothetical protein
MSTRIRKLAEQFRIRNIKYVLKKRTGQAALYAKYGPHDTSPSGYEVIELKVTDLGKTLDFGEICLVEVYPAPNNLNLQCFTNAQEVEAWTALQKLIDRQARQC